MTTTILILTIRKYRRYQTIFITEMILTIKIVLKTTGYSTPKLNFVLVIIMLLLILIQQKLVRAMEIVVDH